MTLARTSTVALTAALLLSPAPALAAAHHHGGDQRHAGKHHSAGHAGRTHLSDRLDHVRAHLRHLNAQLRTAGLTDRQEKQLTGRFGNRDDVAALRRALKHAQGARDLRKVSARIRQFDALVAQQAGAVHLLIQVDGSLDHWSRLDQRLQDDSASLQEAEENPEVMDELDTAVADLDAAQEVLTDDLNRLLGASGQDQATLAAATQRVARDLNRVATDFSHAIAALERLEHLAG